MLGSALAKASAFLRRHRFEDELDEELRFHLSMEIEENIRRGMTPDQARRHARKSFGPVARAKEEVRATRGLAAADALDSDVRYAWRGLRKNAGFSAVIIITLALGIGVNTAIFSVIYGVLLRPLPYASGSELVLLRQQATRLELDSLPFSALEIEDYRTQSVSFDALVEYHTMPFILLGRGDPERVQTGVVSAAFFDVLGVAPLLGRTFHPEDEALDAKPVLVLSFEYWQRVHDGDPDIVGKRFEMNDREHEVVGVLPPLPDFPDANDVFMPSSACPFRTDRDFLADRNARMMRLFGKLSPGVSLSDVETDLDHVAELIASEHPDNYPKAAGYGIRATTLTDELTAKARPTLFVLLATSGFILLIACANVANITLSSLVRRKKELAVRVALGAGRGRMLRQLITESTLLAILGGGTGLLVAWVALDVLVQFASPFTPRAQEIALDVPVLAFTASLSVLTGIAFGVIPAVGSQRRVGNALADTGSGYSAGARTERLRGTLVVAQVAVSLVLLTGAGLMARSLIRLQQVDAGFDPDRVLTMLLDLNWSKYDDPELVRAFHHRLLRSLEEHPGIVSAAVGRTFPLNRDGGPATQPFELETMDRPLLADDERQPIVDFHAVSPNYFLTIGVPLVEGRFFTNEDGANGEPVAIVSLAAAQNYWPGESAIGQRLSRDGGETWSTVVGVVGDVRQYQLDSEAKESAYVPVAQAPLRETNLMVRTASHPIAIAEELTKVIYAMDPEQPVARVQTLVDAKRDSIAAPRHTTTLLALFAILALAMTAAGLSGVLGLSVNQRRHELGIRLALGATPHRLSALVLTEGLRLVLVGLACGLVVALAFTGLLSGLLFEVEPTDPLTLTMVLLVLLLVSVAACWLPARRATNIDPLSTLRTD